MKFLSMHMPAYGPFTDFDLEFGSPGLQIVFGPNESGKSSSLRAFRALLYGVHPKTPDAFVHPYTKLAIRARLQHSDGSVLEIVRRKGNKETLKTQEGEIVEEADFSRFIGNLTEEVFDRLYGLNHKTLADGGEALLAEGGKVGESLFAANVGPAFREVRKNLLKEAEELWRPRGKKQLLNATIDEWKQATKKVKEDSLQVSKFEALQLELQEQEKLLHGVREELAVVRVRLESLRNQKKALPSWARFKELQKELESFGELPVLGDDFSRRREEAHNDYKQAMAELARLKAERAALEQKLSELPTNWPVLEAADAIENLYRRASRAEDILTEIPLLEAELKKLESRVTSGREDLGLCRESDQFPSSTVRAEAAQLALEFQELTKDQAGVEEAITKLEARLARWEKQKTELKVEAGIPELQLMLEKARAGANWESRLEQLRGEYKAARTNLDAELQALPFWNGSLEQLRSLPVPSVECVDRFDKELQTAEHVVQRLKQEKDSLVKRLERVRAELAGMEAEGSVPSPERLRELRRDRDRQFEEVVSHWDSGKKPQQVQGAITGYRGAVERADRHSDDIARDAERVARRAELLKQRDGFDTELQGVEKRRQESEEALAAQRKEWAGLWSQVQVRPPNEMRRWLEQRQSVLQKSRDFETVQKEGTSLDKQRQEALDGLVAVLKRFFPEADLPLDNLSQTLNFVEEKLNSAKESSGRRGSIEELLTEGKSDLDALKAKQKQLRQSLQDWQPRWEATLSHFSLQKVPTPQALSSILKEYEKLQQAMESLDSTRRELDKLRAEREIFELQARELEPLAPDLAEQKPVALSQSLHSRLVQAREEKKKRLELDAALEETDKARENARLQLQGAQERVGQLLGEAGASEIEELPALERKIAEKVQTQRLLQQVSESLRDLSSGATLEEFGLTLAALSAEQLELELEELSEREPVLDHSRGEHARRIGELQQMVQQMDGSDRAAAAAERAAQLMTEGVEQVARLMRIQLAEHVLKTEIDRYRQANEGPLLKRSSHYFSLLTCGEYTSLSSAFQDGSEEPVLEATSKTGRLVRVDGMSEGTRDQLYLSLRLATIEQRAGDTEPFPFIVDDVLVHFDKERALATLNVLAEFGRKNQVLLFTHLERDRELAEQLDSGLAAVKCLERLAL